MSFETARKLADAVLLEGYVLYPYRASSAKNRFRWAFGVLAPRAWSEAGGCEEWWLETQVLVEPPARAFGLLRFLQARSRTVEAPDGRPLESLECAGRLHLRWDEGVVREIALPDLASRDSIPFAIPGEETVEEVVDADGNLRGRVRRRMLALTGIVRVRSEGVPGERPLSRLSVRVENTTPWTQPQSARDEALRGSLVATHL